MTENSTPPADSRSPSVWIGTYVGGGGKGIYPLIADAAGWTMGLPETGAENASFGVYSPRFDLHYLVDEREAGTLGVHRRDAAGWTRLASVSSGGDAPCHVALGRSQSHLAIANYSSGSTALYRLDPSSGLPVSPPMLYANVGSGPNAERQTSSHAHWVGFGLDDRTLYVTDLGTDAVLAFAVDADRSTLAPARTAFAAPPGSGPRHMLFHPRHPRTAYLACELANTLVVLDVDGSGLDERTCLSTLPAGWQGSSIVAHIGTNAAGDRLYVSNRGHDSIAVFALDENGDATLLQHSPSGGASPRFFLILDDERRMIVAHERDHRVTTLDILPDGTLSPTGIAVVVPGAAFAFVVLPVG